MVKKQEKTEKKPLTRAQKTEATKSIIKELLAIKPMRHNELLDEVARLYATRHEGEDTENMNDVKGRVGSVVDIMKKESEIMYDGSEYALKARSIAPVAEEPAPTPKKRGRAKKAVEEKAEETPVSESKEEVTPVPKKRGRAKKETVAEEGKEGAPAAPIEEPVKETSAPKKRGRKTKAQAEPAPQKEEGKAEVKAEPVPQVKEEKGELVVKPKAEIAQKGVVMDMSFLFGDKKPVLKQEKAPLEERKEEKTAIKAEPVKKEEKPTPSAAVKTVEKEPPQKIAVKKLSTVRPRQEKPLTADEKLKESFLKRLRTLGGDYFEYYSVYLLERYSLKNGRRLEGLKISGGDRDGGIDGEIELTDKLGFKETIYIQSKNWDPEKGREENWVVGETLLQQFIGACACRQAKDGKQHSRGIFITTSRFTPDAKRILDTMSEKIIGYDGTDLYEAAKECAFGLTKKNGEWALDEKLLSGTKAFFEMY